VNPRAEAEQRLDGRYAARVLEPSPPAVDEAPWFADDPVARGEVWDGRPVVSPVRTGDLTWAELASDDSELAEWCRERWLASYKRLDQAPGSLAETRVALHRVAEEVISPARAEANGKIGLRYTFRGFGTPFFAADEQIRVEGSELISIRGGVQDRKPLGVDPQASYFLGDWYGFATSVLEELRFEADRASDPSRVQLWPEHFDIALEVGSEAASARAAYGFSPGDEQHPEPYVYVAPWSAPAPGELWNASGFTGAELSYSELLGAGDQRECALQFLRARMLALGG
jgi:hypothetical protein